MIKRFFKNPWTYILGIPALLFAILTFRGVNPDQIVIWFGLFAFLAAALVSGKYILRAPEVVTSGNVERMSVNIVGWSLILTSYMATAIYRWRFIEAGRPEEWSQTYWNASFVFVSFLGFLLVAWSTRRVSEPPGPPTRRMGLGGVFVGLLSGIGLTSSGILGKALAPIWQWLMHVLGMLPK